MTIHVVQGERKQASRTSRWDGLILRIFLRRRAACRRVEVTFDLDANGILNVSAKDKATGKEQSIRITASGGLAEEDIEKWCAMRRANAEADKKFEELITVTQYL